MLSDLKEHEGKKSNVCMSSYFQYACEFETYSLFVAEKEEQNALPECHLSEKYLFK